MIEQNDDFELYLAEVENVSSLEELKKQLDCNEIDHGNRYIGSHALYYKIWTQSTLIDALENALANSVEYQELMTNKYKVLDNATIEQIKQINELNKKIDSLKLVESQIKNMKDSLEYLIALSTKIRTACLSRSSSPRYWIPGEIFSLSSISFSLANSVISSTICWHIEDRSKSSLLMSSC